MKTMKKGMLSLLMITTVLTLTSCDMRLREAKTIEQGVLKVGMNLQIPSMCYLPENADKPEGFDVELAEMLANKLNLELEIIDTSNENLLKTLDAGLYDCVISAVGISQWNDVHYDHTTAYADIATIKDQTGIISKDTKIAIFTKKYNLMRDELEGKLQMLRNDKSLQKLSMKYFKKDITKIS